MCGETRTVEGAGEKRLASDPGTDLCLGKKCGMILAKAVVDVVNVIKVPEMKKI